jgi:hypothetical protein
MTDTRNTGGTLAMPKRGAMATPRHVLAAAMPFASATAEAAAAPAEYIKIPAHISMWGNDVHGDCVTAEEAFAKACHAPEIFITDAAVMSWATAHAVLEGAYLHEVLQWMVNDGFREARHVYDDGPSFTVNWMIRANLTSAIAKGPVKIGIAADQLATVWHANNGHNGWFATGFHPDSNEDHCTSLCGYGPLAWLAEQLRVRVPHGVNGRNFGYAMFTWNSIGIIDEPSMHAITHEAWLRRPTTVINPGGTAAKAGEKEAAEVA